MKRISETLVVARIFESALFAIILSKEAYILEMAN